MVSDIILIVVIIASTILGYIQSNRQKALYNLRLENIEIKQRRLNQQLKNVDAMYINALLVFQAYFTEIEDYENAKKCQDILLSNTKIPNTNEQANS